MEKMPFVSSDINVIVYSGPNITLVTASRRLTLVLAARTNVKRLDAVTKVIFGPECTITYILVPALLLGYRDYL